MMFDCQCRPKRHGTAQRVGYGARQIDEHAPPSAASIRAVAGWRQQAEFLKEDQWKHCGLRRNGPGRASLVLT